MTVEYQKADAIEEPAWQRWLMLLVVWVPAAIFFTAIVAVVTGIGCTYLGFFAGPAMGVFCAYALYRFQSVRRRRRALLVLSYVETAVRLNLPLGDYLLAAELSESGTTRWRLYDLRQLLARGLPLGVAIREAVPEMPSNITAAISAAEPMGQLQVTLGRLSEQEVVPVFDPATERLPFYRFYAVAVYFMVLSVITFYMIFIVPKFKEIFRDFNTSLPLSTRYLFSLGDFLVIDTPLGFIVIAVMGLACFLGIGMFLERGFILRRPSGKRRPLLDTIVWYTPILRRLFRDRTMGDICSLLADASRAAIPLPDALERAGALDINANARRQLFEWREGLLAGQSPADAAIRAGLPPLVTGLLNPVQSERAGNPQSSADAFDFLARYYRAHFSRLIVLIRAAAEPSLVLLLGVVVGFVAFALMSPLAALIQSVARLSNPGVL